MLHPLNALLHFKTFYVGPVVQSLKDLRYLRL